MRYVGYSHAAQTINEMMEYIREVEKEVNYEDLVNRIYSAEMNEDLRSKLVEITFNSKDFLEKHLGEIEVLSNNLNQANYNRTRLAIMKMHNMEELDNMSQQTQNLKGDSQGTQPKPSEHRKESIHAQQHKANGASNNKPDDSYQSLDDIPDERFEPPMPHYQEGYDQDEVDQTPQRISPIAEQDYPDYGEYVKARESGHLEISPIHASGNGPNNGALKQEPFGSDDSASEALNKMLHNDKKVAVEKNQHLIERQDSPPSQMLIPDERSYKAQNSDNSKIRAANRELDDLLGFEDQKEPNYIKKANPQESGLGSSPMSIPSENARIENIEDRQNNFPSKNQTSAGTAAVNERIEALSAENARLKQSLETLKKPDSEKAEKSSAIRAVILEDQLVAANRTIKDLREENDSLRGQIEVL